MTDARHLNFQTWSPSSSLAHPDAPAGGAGPGHAVAADPRGESWLPEWLAHPGSIKANLQRYETELPGYVFAQRVDAVYEALLLARHYVPSAIYDATGQTLEELIGGIIPGLLACIGVMVLTTVVGAAAGAAIGAALGALAFGAGAAPGAVAGGVAGGELGFDAGVYLLEYLGVAFLAAYIAKALLDCVKSAGVAVETAWRSADRPATQQVAVDAAARGLANAVGYLVKGLLQGIVAYLFAKGASAAAGRVPELVGRLRESKLGGAFADWVGENWGRLLKEPKLREGEVAPVENGGGGSSDGAGKLKVPTSAAKKPALAGDPANPNTPQKTAAGSSPLGTVLSSHSAIKPGPLADNLAETFKGGRYSVVQLQGEVTFYRAGTVDQPLGQFFTTTPPTSAIQARIDSAVLPVWPSGATSPLDTAFTVSIPKGTLVYVGEVGSQGGFFVGGTQQILVVKPWNIPGIRVIASEPLK